MTDPATHHRRAVAALTDRSHYRHEVEFQADWLVNAAAPHLRDMFIAEGLAEGLAQQIEVDMHWPDGSMAILIEQLAERGAALIMKGVPE